MDGWTAADVAALVERRTESAAPLDRLEAAVSVVDELRDVGEEVLDRFVAEARAAGCSWSEIGAVLGVSKQAAQQRFPAGGPLSSWPDGVTDTVRAAMVAAQEESRYLGHNYVGNEHLLLGLLAQTDGMAADVLGGLGVTREGIVSRTREVVGAGPRPRRDRGPAGYRPIPAHPAAAPPHATTEALVGRPRGRRRSRPDPDRP